MPGFRARRALAVVGVLVALAFAVPRVMTHTPYARLGVQLEWTPQGHARVMRVVGPPSQGLLKAGDILLTLNGMPFDRKPLSQSYSARSLPREAITFGVRRGRALLEVVIPPARISLWQRIRYLVIPLAAVIAAPLVAFALVWRRPDLSTAWVFLWYAALQAVAVVHEIYRFPEFEPAGAFRLFMGLYGGLVCWAPTSFLHFMAVFPRPRWRAGSWRSNPWLWLVALAYVVPLFFVVELVQTGRLGSVAFRVFESATLLLGVILLGERYAHRAQPEWAPSRSQRALAFAVGGLLVAAAVLGWLLEEEAAVPFLQLPLVRVLVPVIGVSVLFTPFIIAYLIALDPAFDPRRIIQRSLPYAILSGVLAALYLVLVLLGQRLFAAVTGEQAVVFNVVAALALAFLFAPARESLQRAIDRFFRRDPRMLRAALDQAGRELLGALDRDEVRASVETGISRGLGREVAIEWPDQGPPRLAQPDMLDDDAHGAVENLLLQAGIRLENLALQEHRATAERHAVELREAATRAELRALHAQVQPHFLFNALNALSYLTETDPPAAQRFTERLADMLRYTVEAGSRATALLSDEIAFVQDYLGVARERYEGELSFTYHGPRELLSAAVPPLLLQPLVENSLKHGFSTDRGGLSLALQARRNDGWLELTFTDDGCLSGNGSHGLGVGLENLEQRVRRFAGSEASMNAGPAPGGGFAVTLRWREVRAEKVA